MVQLVNDEWFRKPFSKLESTLRFPRLIKFALLLFFFRVFPLWSLVSLLVWYITGKLGLGILFGFLMVLVFEMFSLRSWFINKVLPIHKKNIVEIRNLREVFPKLQLSDQLRMVEEAVDRASWGTINIGYVGVPAWGWEIVFRLIFPLIVKNEGFFYTNLLIGFENKSFEADEKLWEVSQINNKADQDRALSRYLEEYGSRVEDVDLAYPTFREQTDAVKSILGLDSKSPSPRDSLDRAIKKRETSFKIILANARIPAVMFKNLVHRVQENVILREDRRFYEFQGDYDIRQMLLFLASEFQIDPKVLFTMSWKEIKHVASQR